MCIIAIAYDYHPKYQLIIASNRDEYFDRPTSPVHFWQDYPNILAGRDLQELGTWLGITKTGRFAALTNYRDPASNNSSAISRGKLVGNYLKTDSLPNQYFKEIQPIEHKYNSFNLLCGTFSKDLMTLWHYSNRASFQQLKPGLYGLSNYLMDSPWPKVIRLKQLIKNCLTANDFTTNDLFNILLDKRTPADQELPHTGIDFEWERVLSTIFVSEYKGYATRSSTVLLIDKKRHVHLLERNYLPKNSDWYENSYQFQLL